MAAMQGPHSHSPQTLSKNEAQNMAFKLLFLSFLFSSLPQHHRTQPIPFTCLCFGPSSTPTSSSSGYSSDGSALPYDILAKIAASFDYSNLRALWPLRQAMLLLWWGKRFKHGHRGVRPNVDNALDSFMKATARKGCDLAWLRTSLVRRLSLFVHLFLSIFGVLVPTNEVENGRLEFEKSDWVRVLEDLVLED